MQLCRTSGRPDLNWKPYAPKAYALPIELRPGLPLNSPLRVRLPLRLTIFSGGNSSNLPLRDPLGEICRLRAQGRH